MIEGQVWVAVGGFLTYGPAIAAVLAARVVGGRGQLRELGNRLTRVRVGWRWYAVAVFGPALAGGMITGLNTLTTAVLWMVTIGAATIGWRRGSGPAGIATAVAALCVLVNPLAHDTSWTGVVQRVCLGSLIACCCCVARWPAPSGRDTDR